MREKIMFEALIGFQGDGLGHMTRVAMSVLSRSRSESEPKAARLSCNECDNGGDLWRTASISPS
jgi:hypothetical protein